MKDFEEIVASEENLNAELDRIRTEIRTIMVQVYCARAADDDGLLSEAGQERLDKWFLVKCAHVDELVKQAVQLRQLYDTKTEIDRINEIRAKL